MINQISLVGDSLTSATIYSYAQFQGGPGVWVDYVAERLGVIPGIGPLISPGVKFIGLGINALPDTEWQFTTGADAWTASANGDAWNKLPYYYGRYATGATKIATYNVGVGRPVVGFDLWWIDIAGGGDWSYSIDGGSWTAGITGWGGTNQLLKFYVNSPVTSTVRIRAADAAGSARLTCPAGITPYYVDPTSVTQGLIINNYAINGQVLDSFVPVAQSSCLDNVGPTLNKAVPLSSTPNVGTIMMHVNDVAGAGFTSTLWNTDLNTLYNRASALGPVLWMNPHECNNSPYVVATQAAYRAVTKQNRAVSRNPKPVLDLYDVFAQAGIGPGYATLQALGYLTDNTHQSAMGHLYQSDKIYWFIRNNLFDCRTSNQFRLGQSRIGGTSRLGGATSAVPPTPPTNAIGGGTGTGKKGLKTGDGVSTGGVAW